jgi:hypothetical protein
MLNSGHKDSFSTGQDLLPNGAFPLLEAICPPNSADTEKATYLLRMLQMALETENATEPNLGQPR